MDLHQIYFLIILAVALYFFISEKLTVDMTAVFIILALAVSGVLDAKEAFSGFASEPALIVCAVFVLSAGLAATGVTDSIGNAVARFGGKNQFTANLVIMATVAILSAFTHHLMITAMMLPIAMRISRENEIPSSRLLIPMATAASLGTTLTLIGAPAFLLANGILKRAGEPGLKLFSVTPLGAVLVVSGFILILLTLWLLPKTSGKDKADEKFRITEIFTELLVTEDSQWRDVPLNDFKTEMAKRFEVVGMKRYGQRMSILQDIKLQAQDLILVKTTPDELLSVDEKMGLALRAVKKYGEQLEPAGDDKKTRPAKEPFIVQGLVAPQSQLIGKTPGEVDFLHSLGVLVVGIWRKEGWIYHELSEVRLKEGDMIILWGDEETFDKINRDSHFLLLFPLNVRPKKRIKARLATGIMLGAVGLAAVEVLPPHIAFLLGAFLMVLTKCVSLPRAYESIEVKIFVMIAGVIPLGLAMEKTGLAKLFAENLASFTSHWPPWAILLCFFSAAALLTQILSDAATTVLIAPIAVAFAKDMHMSPTAMVVCVVVGAVASFLTPIGHHGNLLVLGPGNYRFVDFLKIGLPLTILIAGATVYMSLRMWG